MWFKAHYQDWAKQPSGFSQARWPLDHTALLNERIANWTVGGHDVDIEAQNRFELRGKTATLAGRPDIIVRPEGHVVIVDAKTGHDSPSHAVQVMIYLYAVPKAIEQYRNAKLSGRVTHRDHTVRIPADAVEDAFIENLGALIRRLSADAPARRVPSRQECRFCDITDADCPKRAESAQNPRTPPPKTFDAVRVIADPKHRWDNCRRLLETPIRPSESES